MPLCRGLELDMPCEGLDAGMLKRKKAITDPARQLDRRGVALLLWRANISSAPALARFQDADDCVASFAFMERHITA
jgi:hypothetical protein